ncbi:MAG: response regulator [Proteobacteria bacterium]|nr:response regulator [Pseudomonadota bacterium]
MKRVLIVEDSETNLTLLKDLVERVCKCVVHTAGDGETAVEAARTVLPDLILMDVGLPGMDGIEALKIIRSTPAGEKVPALALTGYASDQDRKHLLSQGFDGYLAKPFDLPKLLSILSKYLETRI